MNDPVWVLALSGQGVVFVVGDYKFFSWIYEVL